jgi:hypothetical protein
VIRRAKRYANSQGTSLSGWIEQALREASAKPDQAFSARWFGRFRAAKRKSERYRRLAQKYL